MAAGQAFKFHGSFIRVLTGYDTDSPALAITGITQANPPVVSAAAHGLSDGDVVKIDNVVGMTEVNEQVFIIEELTSGTFSLLGVDATGYGAYVSGGEVYPAQFSNFCELTNYNRTGGTSPEVPRTSLCSTAQEFILGLPDYGTTQVDYNFAPQTAIQLAMKGFYESGDITGFQIDLPNGGGQMTQLGFVQQMSEQAGVGTPLWTGSATFRNTGAREDFANA